MGTFVICWASLYYKFFFFFQTLVQFFFLGFIFFLLESRANKFFFFFKFEGVPNTNKIKKKFNYYIYIFFSGQGVPTIDKRAIIYISSRCSFIYICEEKDLTMDSMPNKKKLHIAMPYSY